MRKKKIGFKKHLPALFPREFFMFVLLISNHTVFSFNLKLICICEFFKKLKLHLPKWLVQINSKLNEKTVWLPTQTIIKLGYARKRLNRLYEWIKKLFLFALQNEKNNNQPQFFTVLSHSLATTFWVGNFGSIFEGRRTVYWNQFLFSITRVQRLCFYIYKWHSYFHGPPVTGNENCFSYYHYLYDYNYYYYFVNIYWGWISMVHRPVFCSSCWRYVSILQAFFFLIIVHATNSIK